MHEAIELMGLEFVIPDFDFPTLRVEHHEFRGRVRVRIEHGRHRPVTLALTGAVGVVEGVLDDANEEAVGAVSPIASRGVDRGQACPEPRREGAVVECTNDLEDHTVGHATDDVRATA